MSSIVDEYFDTPIENVDTEDVFPCKGCGEILEEGKAFELAGLRWHLDCFRCHSCGTLLDSDANLLLLGDGSLICNNCTYSCSACGNKIEDLAILTGDQAFCATCFRCRNCKRKIENLRYARTSQGIFCMGCHETLMARRRKKSKAAAAAKAREKENSPVVMEKSLPALPPSAMPSGAFSAERVDHDSDAPTELSPRPRPSHRHNEPPSRGSSGTSRSPEQPDGSSRGESLSLPASTYRKNRNSVIYQTADSAAAGQSPESFFIPVALDQSPLPSVTPDGSKRKDKDYFGRAKSSASEKRDESAASTPHIAFQEKGRKPSTDLDVARLKPGKFSKSLEQNPPKNSYSGDEFKLQDAPMPRKALASSSSSSQSSANQDGASGKTSTGVSRDESYSNLTDPKSANEPQPRTSDDVDGAKPSNNGLSRKEVSSRNTNGQSTPRISQSEQTNKNNPYTQPRSAPPPPPTGQAHHAHKASGSNREPSSPKVSPKLPRWSSGGDFSMDEDMARILGTDEGSSSILRRVSNVVRHGRTGSVETGQHPPSARRISHARSISETTRATASPRWPKTPGDDQHGFAHDISSPLSLPTSDDAALLKRQLRNSEQRVAELERKFTTETDLQHLNKKLVEKRKTVSVLDTQTEIMIRQLEVLAGYVERAKETKTPIDPQELEDSALKDFVKKLEMLKLAMSESLVKLHEERDLLIEEKNQAAADRDRALMEFEQLSSKNAQLADMNNDLTHQIQERFKSQIGDLKASNGLGIYGPGKSGTGSSLNLDSASMTTGATLVADEEPIVEAGPTVVQVRKGQVKKFNWKKGSKTMAQNVAKGVNRAVGALQNDRERLQQQQQHQGLSGLAGDNIGLPYNMTVTHMDSLAPATVNGQNKQQLDAAGRQGFGFFGRKNTMPKYASANAINSSTTAAEPPSVLFGSDLVERAEYERRHIPTLVTRCIEEVELRGMDQEGIYRKTGGNSQVTMIKEGLDKDENFDISDPDLDITAVTSVLKQYFRKLPVPLLTFDIYDRVLESNTIVDDEERCAHLKKTFASMPERHLDCLEFLMFHLGRVAVREPENLMSAKNLAVVFAPTIMRDLSIEREMTDMHAKNIAVQFVIENGKRIFDDAQ